MNTGNPLVSIIVRTKDRPQLLIKALKSIAAQTYRPIEVVLVNDGGCNLDVERLTGILGDISLKYIKIEENRGRPHAGNIGIKNTGGEYIGFLDDDDEIYPEHIYTLVSFLKSQHYYKIAYTGTEMIFKDISNEKAGEIEVKKELFSKEFSYDELIFGNYIPFNSILLPREIMNSTNCFDEKLDLYEDWDFLLRIGQKYPFCHIDKLTAKYNQWCRNLQINRRDLDYSESIRLKIIDKYRDKISSKFLLKMWKEHERKEALIPELENVIQTMNNTIGWRFLKKIRKIREKFFPYDTKRRKIYDAWIKLIKSRL
jgi:glycosyltransferase involved in cell wall biosynthesis